MSLQIVEGEVLLQTCLAASALYPAPFFGNDAMHSEEVNSFTGTSPAMFLVLHTTEMRRLLGWIQSRADIGAVENWPCVSNSSKTS